MRSFVGISASLDISFTMSFTVEKPTHSRVEKKKKLNEWGPGIELQTADHQLVTFSSVIHPHGVNIFLQLNTTRLHLFNTPFPALIELHFRQSIAWCCSASASRLLENWQNECRVWVLILINSILQDYIDSTAFLAISHLRCSVNPVMKFSFPFRVHFLPVFCQVGSPLQVFVCLCYFFLPFCHLCLAPSCLSFVHTLMMSM